MDHIDYFYDNNKYDFIGYLSKKKLITKLIPRIITDNNYLLFAKIKDNLSELEKDAFIKRSNISLLAKHANSFFILDFLIEDNHSIPYFEILHKSIYYKNYELEKYIKSKIEESGIMKDAPST